MIDPNYLCPGCMRQRKSLEGSCPYCGFETKEYRKTVSARVLPPRTILAGKYMLGKVLGEGGFGITYLAWDLNREQRIAIKEYFPAGLVTRDTANAHTEQISVISGSKKVYYEHGLQSFKEEAKNLASLWNVESVVSVRDFFFENETAYLVMEYLDGQNLKQYLSEAPGKRIGAAEALRMMLPIMEALFALHNMGVIHRDISPENIIITREGKIKLIDFGAARVAVGIETQSLTVVLKHGYAPVEQYQTRGKQGAWTDIYALCATLYRMISGITPDPSIDRMAEDKMESLYELSRKIPDIKVTKGVSDAIQKGLALKKEERWQKVDELKTALGIKEEEKWEKKFQNDNNKRIEAKQPAIVKEDRIPVESRSAIVKGDRIPVELQPIIVKEDKIPVKPQPEKRDKRRLALKIVIGICVICAVILMVHPFSKKIDSDSSSFSDVRQDDWFYDYVAYVNANHLMTGLNDITFGPGQPLARAQFAVILHRMNNTPEITYTAKFPDVPDEQWYTDAILWTNSIGVVTGYSNTGLFGAADNINREQMAVMMYRYANHMGYDTSVKADFSKFSDASSVSEFAGEAMQWAVGNAIITGKDNETRLDPQGNASRAECATIIMRFVEKYK